MQFFGQNKSFVNQNIHVTNQGKCISRLLEKERKNDKILEDFCSENAKFRQVFIYKLLINHKIEATTFVS